MKITRVHAREILDSRGDPTLEVEVLLSDGTRGRAAVPSGASTGRFEAVELRDGDPKRYHGKGMHKAIANIYEILAPAILGMDAHRQQALDERLISLDGTTNKGRLGANTLLGVSLAVARAAARSRDLPLYQHIAQLAAEPSPLLPMPLMNVLNGGVHADNGLDIQEFMIVPVGARRFQDAIRMGAEVFQTLKTLLKTRGLSTAVGDEGGFAPRVQGNTEGMSLLLQAIEESDYTPGEDLALALDMAASEFFDPEDGRYHFEGRPLTSADLIELYASWFTEFPLISLEDGLAEDDWTGWQSLTARLGQQVQLVGDDLFVTNSARLQRGIAQSVANTILVKPNQVGTLTETLETIRLARSANYGIILSHRSGETEDTFIADLAVGTAGGQIKTGSLSRSERTAKYNRLLRLEDRFELKLASWELPR
jgi:enolase